MKDFKNAELSEIDEKALENVSGGIVTIEHIPAMAKFQEICPECGHIYREFQGSEVESHCAVARATPCPGCNKAIQPVMNKIVEQRGNHFHRIIDSGSLTKR